MGVWFHLVSTWKIDLGISLYVNGCPVKENVEPKSTDDDPRGTSHDDFVLGRPNSGRQKYGQLTLDELYMYESRQSAEFASDVYWYYFFGR